MVLSIGLANLFLFVIIVFDHYVMTQDRLSDSLNLMKAVMQLKINWRDYLDVLKESTRILNTV